MLYRFKRANTSEKCCWHTLETFLKHSLGELFKLKKKNKEARFDQCHKFDYLINNWLHNVSLFKAVKIPKLYWFKLYFDSQIFNVCTGIEFHISHKLMHSCYVAEFSNMYFHLLTLWRMHSTIWSLGKTSRYFWIVFRGSDVWTYICLNEQDNSVFTHVNVLLTTFPFLSHLPCISC